jgi:putative ATP-dependent endonuclease of OLD family
MKIRRLKLSNFRSVAEGEVIFPGHTVLIGGNSVGKSTICEALDLLLGPDRLARTSPIDEHDFFERRYLDDEDSPILIELEVVLTDLSTDVLTKFRTHREYWNTATNTLLDETATPEDVDDDEVIPAFRIRFEGSYDIEEDEFRAETFFASPPSDDETRRARVSRAAKRTFGFIYLRALRTGARALSLERGSLLDIILKLKDDDRSAMWEQTLAAMEDLDPAIDAIPQLRAILDEIDGRVRQFVSLSADDRTFRLYPSALTRESLRRSITLFGSSERSNTPVPYWRLGSGVINSMVFSLLTFIAELKSNVIFAMEEPEIAIPPHTQRRIVQFLQRKMDQSILTTHSPFVLEQYDPDNVILLERGNDAVVGGRRIEVAGIKAKTYKGNLRRVLAEAMLGNGVLCVEGVSDAEAIYSASAVLEEKGEEGTYTPLDLSGVTIVQCEGDGGLLRYGEFFSELGLKTYAFYDRQKNDAISDQIEEVFDAAWKLEQTGIEYLLADEITIDVIRTFLLGAAEWDDYPHNPKNPALFAYDPDTDDDDVRKVCKRVLRSRKGSGYAQRLVELCSDEDLPDIIVEALEHISEDLPKELDGDDDDAGEPDTDD